MKYVCCDCMDSFDEEDAVVERTTYENELGLTGSYTPLTYLTCPYCGSDQLDEVEDEQDDY